MYKSTLESLFFLFSSFPSLPVLPPCILLPSMVRDVSLNDSISIRLWMYANKLELKANLL